MTAARATTARTNRLRAGLRSGFGGRVGLAPVDGGGTVPGSGGTGPLRRLAPDRTYGRSVSGSDGCEGSRGIGAEIRSTGAAPGQPGAAAGRRPAGTGGIPARRARTTSGATGADAGSGAPGTGGMPSRTSAG